MEVIATPLSKIVIFDDDEANLRLYRNSFKSTFDVKTSQNPFRFQELLTEDVDAILIDVLMPLKDGILLSQELKTHTAYNGCPLIFISASGSETVLRDALLNGGQDFLSRNMSRDEMVLRIKNKIEYFKSHRSIYRLGDLKLDCEELKAYHSEDSQVLTLTEMKILRHLIKCFPQTLSRHEINEAIWPGQIVLPSTLNTHLSNLRNKFHTWNFEIQNMKGVGIRLVKRVA